MPVTSRGAWLTRRRRRVLWQGSSGCSETLRGRLSNALRFGSFSMTMSESHSFAGSTNDAVIRKLRVAPSLVEAFVLKWEPGYRYHSMRRAVHLCFSIPLPVARMSESCSCGASGHFARRANWLSRAWGKDLGCLCDLFQPHGTRTPRSWNCRCSARLPKAAHQSLPRPAVLLDAIDERRAVTALVETKKWSSKLPSSQS